MQATFQSIQSEDNKVAHYMESRHSVLNQVCYLISLASS